MMLLTHAGIALLLWLIGQKLLPGIGTLTFAFFFMLFAVVLDVDHAFLGKRGLLHGLFPALAIFLASYMYNTLIAFTIVSGYLLHLLLDSLTPQGIMWFSPLSKYRVRGPIRTRSIGEFLFLACSIAAGVALLCIMQWMITV